MIASRSHIVVLSLTAAALGIAGCGGSGKGTVHGKVAYPDGTPLTGAIVYFQPTEEKQGKLVPRGYLQADGTYDLATNSPKEGVAVGKYKVTVASASNGLEARTFDVKFEDPQTSGLQFEVKPGRNEYPITVTKGGKAAPKFIRD